MEGLALDDFHRFSDGFIRFDGFQGLGVRNEWWASPGAFETLRASNPRGLLELDDWKHCKNSRNWRACRIGWRLNGLEGLEGLISYEFNRFSQDFIRFDEFQGFLASFHA